MARNGGIMKTKKLKELIKFLKRPLDGKIAKVLTWEENKILLDYIEDLESKNKEKIILNKLEEWLKSIPNYFMDKRSFNNGVYIEQGMQKQIDLTLDKIKELRRNTNDR